MLTNDRGGLQNTLDVINTLPGIEDVNMYDNNDNLVYSPYSNDSIGYNNPNCKECHANFDSMFPRKTKTFRIVNLDSECEMSKKDYDFRLVRPEGAENGLLYLEARPKAAGVSVGRRPA